MTSPVADREAGSDSVDLATIARPGGKFGPPGELRVSLSEFKGHQYLSIRLFEAGRDGTLWPVKGKGISVRLHEGQAVADAIIEGIARSGWTANERPANASPRTPDAPTTFARPGRRSGPDKPVLLSGSLDQDEAKRQAGDEGPNR